MRNYLFAGWLSFIFISILFIFWQSEWKYSQPTPLPSNYREVKTGTLIHTAYWLNEMPAKPIFLHFFNPACPCSRFNIPQFRFLAKKYGDRINFKIVLCNSNKTYSADEIKKKFDLAVPVLYDTSSALACGVYSTPQAVLIDAGHYLYYRGNYNKSRYCTDLSTNYAGEAIDSLLQRVNAQFSTAAARSYGCSLPVCNK